MPLKTLQKQWTYNWVGHGESPADIPEYTVYIEVQSTEEETWYWRGDAGSKSIYLGPRPIPPQH